MKFAFLLIAACFIICICSHKADAIGKSNDSINVSTPTKTKLFFKFDNRLSFISDKLTKVTGFKFGFDYNDKIRIGAGNHRLQSPVVQTHYVDSAGIVIDSVPEYLRMSYVGLFAEYVFYKTKKWEFSVPVQFGFGNSRYDYTLEDIVYKTQKNPIVVFESNIEGHYKIIPYLGIGGGTGIRLMLVNNKEIEEKFDSPVFILKIKLFLGEIYRDIFNRKKNG